MKEPGLALCGHLFDIAACQIGKDICPIDHGRITKLIPFQELKQEISQNRLSHLLLSDSNLDKSKEVHQETNALSAQSEQSTWKTIVSSNGKKEAEEPNILSRFNASQPRVSPLFEAIPKYRLKGEYKREFNRGYVAKISNAHKDDIHGIAALDENRFVSGSKDNDIKIWNIQGRCERTFPPQFDGTYKAWVTALCVLKDGTIVSGSRNGIILYWDQNGNIEIKRRYTPSSSPICKKRNQNRIHCVSEYLYSNSNSPMFFTGTACFMQLWDRKGKRILNEKAHDNDWVYCVSPLDQARLVLAIGADLELWTKQNQRPTIKESLVKEERTRGQNRPFISSVLRLQNQAEQLAIACFDGTVRTVDVEKKKELQKFYGHARGQRVWNIVNVCPNIIASSGEDATVRLWDVRTTNEVLTIQKFPDRVSCLTKLRDTMLIASSCPKNPYATSQKAEITLWDYRYITFT